MGLSNFLPPSSVLPKIFLAVICLLHSDQTPQSLRPALVHFRPLRAPRFLVWRDSAASSAHNPLNRWAANVNILNILNMFSSAHTSDIASNISSPIDVNRPHSAYPATGELCVHVIHRKTVLTLLLIKMTYYPM
jgi:hypothetical protein